MSIERLNLSTLPEQVLEGVLGSMAEQAEEAHSDAVESGCPWSQFESLIQYSVAKDFLSCVESDESKTRTIALQALRIKDLEQQL